MSGKFIICLRSLDVGEFSKTYVDRIRPAITVIYGKPVYYLLCIIDILYVISEILNRT